MTDAEGGSGEPIPRIRARPEDFVVDEVPLYEPTGEGTHTFLRIEKRLLNTEDVVRRLAREIGVSPSEIGYAGRKDRNAITRQWFSAPGIAPERARALELPGVQVLEAHAHPHKLRVGQLRANRFEIRVLDVPASLAEAAEARLLELVRVGLTNRFGDQRFGRDGRNAELGRRLLDGRGGRVDRRQARFLISALQSEVFNRVLAERQIGLDDVEAGDVAQVCESGGAFVVVDVESERSRARAFEISATGPIFGTKMKRAEGDVGAREDAAIAALGLPPLDALRPPRGIRLRGARRPLRVRPESSSIEREAGGGVLLRATLPTGSYVTVLLEELFGAVSEEPG